MKEEIELREEEIATKIHCIRGHKVMLDSDLAELYGVPTKRLNEQVRRNRDRFPEDFMFQLTKDEYETLRSQFATSSHGGRRYMPYVFTEHGAVMLASVLSSSQAVQSSISVVRVFVQLRRMMDAYLELEARLDALEDATRNAMDHQNARIAALFDTLKKLITEQSEPMERVGFRIGGDD